MSDNIQTFVSPALFKDQEAEFVIAHVEKASDEKWGTDNWEWDTTVDPKTNDMTIYTWKKGTTPTGNTPVMFFETKRVSNAGLGHN